MSRLQIAVAILDFFNYLSLFFIIKCYNDLDRICKHNNEKYWL